MLLGACELFVLPPPQRTLRRLEFLAGLGRDAEGKFVDWTRIGRQCRSCNPVVKPLAPRPLGILVSVETARTPGRPNTHDFAGKYKPIRPAVAWLSLIRSPSFSVSPFILLVKSLQITPSPSTVSFPTVPSSMPRTLAEDSIL